MQNSTLIQIIVDAITSTLQSQQVADAITSTLQSQQLVDAITSTLQPQQSDFKQEKNDLISRDEVCQILHFNKTTLHKHTKSGRLKSYGIGGRVLYKRSEVLEAVTPLKK
ncbi:helix-turn-helix domain-containing protein [Flavobacterium xanthum]|uniref:DNA binding domain-containing protein, excisionase family n=1 Tax=Flavobacterium xanthum TaxID=69322 RepID=A0A1M6X9W2_9FLAO|nr:helix-turn-helix domain-containing protein [Flavobacterium xanthum]SHL02770.1 DNA binding domain-containing protein, excisionase family [Flavobacterium xanthum]